MFVFLLMSSLSASLFPLILVVGVEDHSEELLNLPLEWYFEDWHLLLPTYHPMKPCSIEALIFQVIITIRESLPKKPLGM